MADSNVKVDIRYTDERTITLRKLNDKDASDEFSRLLRQATVDGYAISAVDELTAGHQRDPYTIGVRIYMERNAP